jgi:hypothetical protein
MSVISTTGSSLKSTNQPSAFLEACLLLDGAEKLRNGANTGVAPKNNISVTFSSDEGVAQITATLPASISTTALGAIQYLPKDYLSGTYAVFTPGGDVTAVNMMEAVSQVASILAASEKAVTPIEDQPNFVQVESSSENGTITITATLPITVATSLNGAVSITAIDYL